MALDTKDDKDLNPGKADYDDKFDLNDWEARAAAPDTPSDLAAQDQRDAAIQDNNDMPFRPGAASFDDFLDRAGSTEPGSEEAKDLASSTGVEPGSSHTYNPDGKKKTWGERVKGKITKKTGIALATGGAVAGMGFFGFSSLQALTLVHVMENVQDKFFSVGQEAVEQRSEKLFTRFVRNHILKGLGPNCGSTIDRNCRADAVNGNSQAARLFRGWRDARLENRLAEKYGIEFGYDKGRGIYTIKVGDDPPDDLPNFTNIGAGALDEDFDDLFQNKPQRGREAARRALREALENETRMKQVWMRHKVGKLLERKYHLNRCVVACDKRDRFSDKREEKRLVRKAKIVERVIEPRSETAAIVMNCLLEISGCKGNGAPGPHGETRTKAEVDIETKLSDLRSRYGSEKADVLIGRVTNISEKGITNYLLEKILGKTAGAFATKLAGPVGLIDMAVTFNQLATNADTVLKSAKYSAQAASAASVFMMYRSHADEIKSGNVDSELVGSFVNGLGTTDNNQAMGASPVYAELFDPNIDKAAFLGGTAYAQAASEDKGYRCGDKGDGDKLEAGKLVCGEENFGMDNILGDLADFYDNPGNRLLRPVLDVWSSVSGLVSKIVSAGVNVINSIGSIVPGYKELMEKRDEIAANISEFAIDKVIGNPFGPDMSGARTFQGIAAGAAASATENANNGLGGVQLTKAQVAEITEEHEAQQKYAKSKKSLVARLFDTESSDSLASQIAISIPTNNGGLFDAVKGYALNPLPATTTIANTATTTPANAATYGEGIYNATRAYKIQMLGIPRNHPVLNTDPDKLTDEYCTEFNKRWYEGNGTFDGIDFGGTLKEDENTGYRYHTIPNPCLLEKQATAAAGGLFTDEVLEADERDLTGQAATSSSGEITTGVDTSNQQCPNDPDLTDGGIKERYGVGRVLRYKIRVCLIKGNPAFDVNVSIAKKTIDMVRAAQSAGVNLTGGGYRTFDEQVALRGDNGCPDTYTSSASTCETPTARPGESNHEEGTAIDFDGIDKKGKNCTNPGNKYWDWLKANASRYGFTQLSSECWHWSVGGG